MMDCQRTRVLLIALIILSTGGCKSTETRFDILSFRTPASPERLTEHFDPGSFAINAHNNWNIVFEILPELVDVGHAGESVPSPTTAPTETAGNPPDAEPVSMSQILQIEVFWRPQPGTTYVESSQTNASILYCLIAGNNAISYEGAGFVYFQRSRDGKKIKGEIESATLVPVRTVNEPTDHFGPCRIHGSFVAHEDRRHVASVLQQLRKKLGRPAALPGAATTRY